MGRVTIKDVANDAGVSITTASFAINNRTGRISKAAKEKVLASAEKLGYQFTKKNRTISQCVQILKHFIAVPIICCFQPNGNIEHLHHALLYRRKL